MPSINKNAVVAVSKPAREVSIGNEGRALVNSFTSAMPDVAPDRVNTLYFFSKMSKHSDTMRGSIPGISDGAPVLFTSDDDGYYSVDRLMLLRADRFYTEMNDAGDIVQVSLTNKGDPLHEDYQAIVLVVCGDELIPARTSFRKTRAAAARALVRAAKKADPSGTNPLSFASFVGKLRVSNRTRQKGNGTYPIVDADILPASEADRALVESSFANPGFLAALEVVKNAYENRLKYLNGKVA